MTTRIEQSKQSSRFWDAPDINYPDGVIWNQFSSHFFGQIEQRIKQTLTADESITYSTEDKETNIFLILKIDGNLFHINLKLAISPRDRDKITVKFVSQESVSSEVQAKIIRRVLPC